MITSSWEFDWYLPLLVGLLTIGDSVGSVYQIRVGFDSAALFFFLSLCFSLFALPGALPRGSASNPCKGIRLQDIKLTYYGKSFVAYCEHVHGSSSGVVMPRSCL
ncbi:hypothetical protein WN944_015680 [Citrus x changshan-huyou]|uniref:Uncharacterized protein n=1 Tax=Citrus x changshan-huyou TaxID=2935761 RepID=A0AAP0QRB0_9ROSI